MKKYFGTDGIRGEANKELTVDIALRLGYALGYKIKNDAKANNDSSPLKVILATDTRLSGYMIRAALLAGLTSMGVSVDLVGVLPTPAVSYITKVKNANAGIMISASHNPAKDNGIKIFDSTGHKLPDKVELELEALMDDFDNISKECMAGDEVGKFKIADDEYYLYRDYLVSRVNGNFKGMKIILDAANGAAYRIAKDVFLELGAEIVMINDAPNGLNINVNCGSTHPEILSKVVVGYQADLGLAYDGDADRLIAVDCKGNIIDGDKIIATLAVGMKKQKKLNDNKVVTTVMSNMGFEKYLTSHGIELLRANVGDRYVLEKMKTQGINLGGEQSGHIIMLDHNPTGDGVMTSLKLVETIRDSGLKLGEIVSDIEEWPQTLINVRVGRDNKKKWSTNKNISDIILQKEKEIAEHGRILVRTSGTEPIVRVMVEGDDKKMVDNVASDIATVVEKELA